MKKYIWGILSVIALIAFDQWTKWLAVVQLKDQAPFVIWDGVFELNYLENRGAAFGLFQNQKIFFVIATIIVSLVMIFVFVKLPANKRFLPLNIILIFVMAGALGNFIDRIRQSYVVDFFYFRLIDFPLFNMADIYLVCSIIALFIAIVFFYKEDEFTFLNPKKSVAAKGDKNA